MKIALSCRSVLLEKSLRKFLKNHIVLDHEADLIITDHNIKSKKTVLRIGIDKEADLNKPFSRSRLMIKIEEKLQANDTKNVLGKELRFIDEEETLEEKIEKITYNFIKELTEIIKKHYEKKK